MDRNCLTTLFVLILLTATLPAEESSVEQGKQAMLGRHFSPPTISLSAYQNAWKYWDGDLKTPPKNYDAAFRDYYGLHSAPYPNGRYPMGLREAPTILFGRKALATDCLFCHGGSIMGKSYVGLGNVSLDIHALFTDVAKADGLDGSTPFTFSNVRGTTEAGGFAVYLLSLRKPDLTLRTKPLDLDLRDDLCEDAPAWWLLKKKKTMYHTGGGDAHSVRSIMQFMLSPLNSASKFEKEEATFVHIRKYLLSLEAPKYPLPIDHTQASQGEKLFRRNCARCHGAYGKEGKYPNRIVPLAKIGTDPARFNGLSKKFGQYYNRSWFAKERKGWLADDHPALPSEGYQAPPLDGIWATAPYFHNGSVPTVAGVLNSRSRPRVFTRSYRTDREDYDATKLGWKVKVLTKAPDAKMSAYERRKIYDTLRPGRGNGGHIFGDHLTDQERRAVIEYLKTL